MRMIRPEPLTAAAFAPFGDVLDATGDDGTAGTGSVGGTTTTGRAIATGPPAITAAPRATECFGCTSSATGRPTVCSAPRKRWKWPS